MMFIHKTCRALGQLTPLVLICLVLASGCNSRPALVPVSGQVKIDGKPLQQGTVAVWIKDYRPAYGLIDQDGRFAMMTHAPGDGCVMGEHPVTVTSALEFKGDTTKHFIPKKYSDPRQSNLKVTVAEPKQDWVIDLTWKVDPDHKGPWIEK